MNYSSIKFFDTADGAGIRTALYVSGCRIHCKGCHNFEAWDFKSGKPFTDIEANEILESLKPNHIAGLSILGGEPFELENQYEVWKLMDKVKKMFPDKNIWIYSGNTLEDLLAKYDHLPVFGLIMSLADILIDGPYLEAQRNVTLKFRGSENQRIINLATEPLVAKYRNKE
jgi:anaerobic ribonucleoside-triphosphate reductase activating protein